MSTRAMPNNPDAEMAVLGGVLLRNEAMATALDLLSPDDFYVPAHQDIFRAMLSLAERGQPIDPLTLEAGLAAAGKLGQAGGLVYLGELQSRVPTAENLGHYARLVRDAASVRRVIMVAARIAAAGYDGPVDIRGYLDESEQAIFAATEQRGASRPRPLGDLAREVFRSIERRMESGLPPGVMTGFADVDRILGGLRPSEMIVVAARPGVGKTTWAVNVTVNAATAGVPVLFFTIEMSDEEVASRAVHAEARVDSARTRRATGIDADEWHRLTRAVDRLRLPVDIDGTSRTIAQIRSRTRRFLAERGRSQAGHALVVVDYLQLVQPPRELLRFREQAVAWVATQLKLLAKDVQCPVVALAQLNRAVESGDEEPQLHHLRESGQIENDADVVAFLHRPDRDRHDHVRFIVRKHRNGPTGRADLTLLESYTRFENHAHGEIGGDE